MRLMDVTVTIFDEDGEQIGKAIAAVDADKFHAARVGWVDEQHKRSVGAVATVSGSIGSWMADPQWGPGHGGKEDHRG